MWTDKYLICVVLIQLLLLKVVDSTESSNAVNACSGATNPPTCDPLPNGSGEERTDYGGVYLRLGTLGGVVDDFYQDYRGNAGGVWGSYLSSKPINSMSTSEVIAKYGSIETWDTSQVTNMACVFKYKKNINPDIRKWNVSSVVDMEQMFMETNSFNIDLSSWIVASVKKMGQMFYQASAYTQTLCGSTWIETDASITGYIMFRGAGPNDDAKISTVPCCNPGQHFTTTTPKTCTDCTKGKYQDKKGFLESSCKACIAGRYSSSVAAQTDSICKACDAGRYSISGEAQTSIDVCIACVGGKYSISGEAQTTIDVCIACVAGKYSTARSGQSSDVVCNNKCSRGKWSDRTGLTSNADCTECVAGRYSNITEEGQTTIDACNNECAAGTWSALTGSTTPCNKLCSQGKFSSKTGLSSDEQCEGKCSIGKYSNLLGLISDNECQNCSEGKWSNGIGMTSPSDCKPCASGRYSMEIGRKTDCLACPSGYRQPARGKTFCFACVPGEFQQNTGSLVCEPCPANTFSGKQNQTECSLVDPGHYRSGPTTQVKCPAGKAGGGGEEKSCQDCVVGQYRPSQIEVNGVIIDTELTECK